jgi:hypothetical protein
MDKLTDAEALELATAWVAVRRQVRRVLIKLARLSNPLPHDGCSCEPEPEIRKLYYYPSDLSEDRLLALINLPPKPKRPKR